MPLSAEIYINGLKVIWPICLFNGKTSKPQNNHV